MTNRNEALMALAAEIRTSLGNEATASTRRRWAIEIEALASVPSAPVEVPDCMIVLLNHIETLMDNGRLEEDAIPTDMWNAVSTYNVTQQPAEGDGAVGMIELEWLHDHLSRTLSSTQLDRAHAVLDSLAAQPAASVDVDGWTLKVKADRDGEIGVWAVKDGVSIWIDSAGEARGDDCPFCGMPGKHGYEACPALNNLQIFTLVDTPQPDGGDEVECPHCVEGIRPMTFNRPCLHCKGLGVVPNE